jgi:hypothetical protein
VIPTGFLQVVETPLEARKALAELFPRQAPLQVDVFEHFPTIWFPMSLAYSRTPHLVDQA